MQITREIAGQAACVEIAQHPSMLFITQPTYLPWMGIFKAISLSKTYVFYDDQQFVRHSWHNRNRALDPVKREPAFLTVPVAKHHRDTLIRDMLIADPDFYRDHVSKLRAWYARAPFLEPTLEVLLEVYLERKTKLVDLTCGLTMALARYIGFSTSFKFASEFTIPGDKYTRPLGFARSLGCSVYLTQVGTEEYTDIDAFAASGIRVEFLQFPHPEYRQLCQPFVPHLSIVDMLMNIGPEQSAALIEGVELDARLDLKLDSREAGVGAQS
jgi:hypothetical protein